MKVADRRIVKARGFALVELIVVLTVLTVGILGLSASAVLVAARIGRARLELGVRVRAQAELETRLANGGAQSTEGWHDDGSFTIGLEASGERPRRLTLVVLGYRRTAVSADTLVVLERDW